MFNNFLMALAFFFVIVVVGGLYNLSINKKDNSFVEIKVGNKTFEVELADSIIKQSRGLSGRNNLLADKGMLFIFDSEGDRAFWMKGMKFSLDIIWINGDKIVDISKNVLPPANGVIDFKTYSPKVMVDKVLEINSGLSDKYDIKIGQKVEIKYN